MFALLAQTVTAKAVNEELSECQATACAKHDGFLMRRRYLSTGTSSDQSEARPLGANAEGHWAINVNACGIQC